MGLVPSEAAPEELDALDEEAPFAPGLGSAEDVAGRLAEAIAASKPRERAPDAGREASVPATPCDSRGKSAMKARRNGRQTQFGSKRVSTRRSLLQES